MAGGAAPSDNPAAHDPAHPGVLGRTVATIVGALLVGIVVLLAGAAGAGAQPVPQPPGTPAGPPATATTGTATPGTDGPAAEGGEAVVGTLSTPAGPVEGVRVEALAAGGDAVGEDRTGPDGSFRVRVPGPGTYQVHLDTATLPDGVVLAPDGRDRLDRVIVFAGRDKSVVFPLVPGGADGAAAPEAAGSDTVERVLGALVSGVRYGLVIALCALGLTLIYATTGLVNFAHGELVTFGALVTWWLSSSAGAPLPLVLAVVVAFVAGGLFGALQDTVIWQPLRARGIGNISTIVVSIGLSLFLRNLYLVIFSGNARSYAEYATQTALDLGPFSAQPKELATIVVCALALGGTAALLRYTALGTAVRAVADEPDLARSSGIGVRRVVLTVWVLGAALAGLGGTLLGLTEGVQWNMGLRILLVVFAAVVVGGFGSPAGAALGGLLIGVVSEVSTVWIPTDFKDVIALVALVVVLLIRPQGILGVRQRVG